ncbi:MAG: hypothetical protein AAF220_06550, partial [Pseudomonadota bacterium]
MGGGKSKLLAGAVFVGATLSVGLTAAPQPAHALSDGCLNVNATVNGPFTVNDDFEQNETLVFTFTAAGGIPGNFTYDITNPAVGQIFQGPLNGPTTTVSYTVTATGDVTTNPATV